MEVIGKDGRYELRDEIGQGKLGAVHAAMDLRRRLPVVVRRFDRAIAADALAKYAETARTIAGSGVDGAVSPYEVVTSGPAPFAVFAAHDGASLESMLRGGALQWVRAVEIVTRCAEILAAVQAATGVTHGNLKPGNVWITEKGKTLVLDLGTAGLGPPGPVQRGAEVVEYRAPEQLDGAPGDARADVFALGVLLVELTSGIHPFAGATAFKAAHRLLQTPPDPATVTRGMSAGGAQEVAKLVARALAGDPAQRYADARTFAAALAYVRKIVGTPTPLRTEPAPTPPNPPSPAPPAPDPTTVLRLPGLSELRKYLSASPPVPAAAEKDPPSVEPATPEPPPSVQPAPIPASPRPVPADHTEMYPRPGVDSPDDATQALPRIVHNTRPNRPGITTSAPSAFMDDESTQHLPRIVLPPANAELAAPHGPADRTERDMRRPIDDDATQGLPRIPRSPAPVDEEMGTIAMSSRAVPRTPRLEATMLLPETDEHTFAGSDPAPNPAGQARPGAGQPPPSPAIAPSRPATRPPSAHLQSILIAINVFVALALLVIAWVTLR